MARPDKVAVVEEIKEKLESSQGVFVTEYRGLTVGQQQELRRSLRKVDAEYKVVKMSQGLFLFHGNLTGFRVAWSGDSRWAAFSRGLENTNSAIFLYDTKEGDLHQVTAGFNGETNPEFDPDGDYLYFFSSRTFQPSYSDIDNTWIYANTTNVVAVPLRADVASTI